MHRSRRNIALAVVLALQVAVIQADGKTSFSEYLKRSQGPLTGAVVNYCIDAAPETKRDIQAGFSNYLSSLESAANTWIATDSKKRKEVEAQLSSGQVDAEQDQHLQAIEKSAVDGAKKYDPHKYCPWLASNLKASTPESVLKSLREYDERVKAMKAKQGQTEASP